MLLVLCLVLSVCVSTYCHKESADEELEAAFRDIEDALNDRKEIKSMVNEIKSSVIKHPNYKRDALGMVKAISAALPKLTSDNGFTVAEGALSLAAGIAEIVPGGLALASVATLIASVIGIINTEKTDKIKDTMTKVLREARDTDLAEDVDSFMEKTLDLISANKPFTKRKITSEKLNLINIRTTAVLAVGVLSKLTSRINSRRISKNPAEAKRAFDFSVMYAQLATLQDLALTQVIFLLKKDHEDISLSFANTKNGMIDRSRFALFFWNNPLPENAGSLAHYYPLDSSDGGKLLRAFLKRVNVPEAKDWNPSSYVLISVKWPSYHLSYERHDRGGRESGQTTWYLQFSSSTATNHKKIVFEKRSDGYFTLRSESSRYEKYALVQDPKSPKYIIGKSSQPKTNKNHHFIVISYPGTDIITISCRNWPDKFFGGEKHNNYVILRDGNMGSEIQYYTHACLGKDSGNGSYKCPKYTKLA